MAQTNIEWADMSWNVVVGCTRVSSGCANCYAEAIQRRFTPRDQPAPLRWIPGNETVTLHPERLEQPKTWKKGRTIFVCSMADLFHGAVPDAYIKEVFQVMAGPECAQHTFLLLTKRPERMLQLAHLLPWPANIWAGTSVESQYWANRRIPLLAQVPAAIRFLSCEPLLRPVDLIEPLQDGIIQWVIVGGESGPGARPLQPEWVARVRDDCAYYSVPFFFKQWGGPTSKANGRELDGQTHLETPPKTGGPRNGEQGEGERYRAFAGRGMG